MVSSAYGRYDFLSAFVMGLQDMGKMTYAMLVAYEVYGAGTRCSGNLYFNPREALPRLKKALRTGERIPLVVFGDVGMHLSKYLVSSNYE